jgi:hypothetical protein
MRLQSLCTAMAFIGPLTASPPETSLPSTFFTVSADVTVSNIPLAHGLHTQLRHTCTDCSNIKAQHSPDRVTILEPRACPTTVTVTPPQEVGPVSTFYQRTSTVTLSLDCGGCPLVVSTQVQGLGPPVSYTKTITVAATVTTAYRCV